jgi:hypothetical protein
MISPDVDYSVQILINRTKYATMIPYSEYGKEASRARYGRTKGGILHARTGCRTAATQTRQRNQDAPTRGDAWVQSGGSLAYQQRRICTVHEVSEECLSEQGEQVTLSVAGSTPNVSQALSVDPCSRYLVAYCTTVGNGVVRRV